MDTQDIRTLKILEEIDQDQPPSQRDLATTLNVSLGLVNSFIKRLAKKGYFKITNIPANRVRYMLTPKGAAEKTRLTYEFIQYSYQFYKESRSKLSIEFKAFETSGIRSVVFYGAGEFAEIAYASLQETQIELSWIVDDNKYGKRFFGKVIASPEILRGNHRFDKLIVTSVASTRLLTDRSISLGVPPHKIAAIQ